MQETIESGTSYFDQNTEKRSGRYKTQVTGHRSQVTGHRNFNKKLDTPLVFSCLPICFISGYVTIRHIVNTFVLGPS